METPFDLDRFLRSLHRRIGRAGTVIVHHPAEVRHLQNIPTEELVRVATRYHLRCVPHLHGTRFQFTHFARS